MVAQGGSIVAFPSDVFVYYLAYDEGILGEQPRRPGLIHFHLFRQIDSDTMIFSAVETKACSLTPYDQYLQCAQKRQLNKLISLVVM